MGLLTWGDHAPSFPQIQPGELSGASVCMIGLLKEYKGTAQIELRQAGQFQLASGTQ